MVLEGRTWNVARVWCRLLGKVKKYFISSTAYWVSMTNVAYKMKHKVNDVIDSTPVGFLRVSVTFLNTKSPK